ncbi:hypothetical protein CRYUN_Cryun35bG0003400 [Craigia yunnanensis]
MSCFPCINPRSKVRRIDIDNGSRTNSRHSADSSVSGATRGKRTLDEHKKGSDQGKGSKGSGARSFTFRELATATRNFRETNLLGEGGFGKVFKGRLETGEVVAVKQLNHDGLQGFQEFIVEVLMLSLLHHVNLVTLIGYCTAGDQRLLVYEYMPMGSLEDHLFAGGAEPLTWETWLKLAIGAAQGLAFLHSSEKSVIYRDFKASNILLDGAYNAKLSDFGLAKLGPINGNSHVTTRVMGTYGYAAPEYVATGHLYVKSDVYGFGVVLLEMLTGLRALDTNRPSNDHNLVEWTKYSLTEKRKLKKIMDPRLEEQYPLKAALQAGYLILKCLESDPKNRPSMKEVLETLQKISAINEKSKDSKASTLQRKG